MKMSEEEYLASKGLAFPVSDFTLDTCRIPHGETTRQKQKRISASEVAAMEHFNARQRARKEYAKAVKNGEIVPKTKEELLIEKATYGHPDNPSVQAARRLCEKKGLVWQKTVPANG